MIKLIIEAKGSGKTKRLIEEANAAVVNAKGSIICIEPGNELSFQVKPQVRLIDINEYGINDAEEFYGFVCGILAGNYDVTDIFVDSGLKICGGEMANFAEFVFRLEKIANERNINVLIVASAFAESLPAGLERFIDGEKK